MRLKASRVSMPPTSHQAYEVEVPLHDDPGDGGDLASVLVRIVDRGVHREVVRLRESLELLESVVRVEEERKILGVECRYP
jgi:hypothetical protein